MPRLVFSSEKVGCGATIELDNGDTCMISVAQAGVLVRSYKKGFWSGVLGSFLGRYCTMRKTYTAPLRLPPH
jgi:hypothetical protein